MTVNMCNPDSTLPTQRSQDDPKLRHQELPGFLRQLDRAHPGVGLLLVMDSYATPTTPEAKAWPAQHPRFQAHSTPTSGPWLNLVEARFRIIDSQAVRRGAFSPQNDLNAKIRHFISGWINHKHPFVWTNNPE